MVSSVSASATTRPVRKLTATGIGPAAAIRRNWAMIDSGTPAMVQSTSERRSRARR